MGDAGRQAPLHHPVAFGATPPWQEGSFLAR
jgi:hypothetical protein